MLGLVIAVAAAPINLRPPAVPLITHDPYFSIWSRADHAYDTDSSHWTGRTHALNATVTIDKKQFRILGSGSLPPLPQTSLIVSATQTRYTFANAQVQVELKFTSPALPNDLDLFSRPVTYVSFDTTSLDGKPHEINLAFNLSGTVAANEPEQLVSTQTKVANKVSFSRVGTIEQPVLQKRGDDLRIDWGYAYLSSATDQGWQHASGASGSTPASQAKLTATKSLGRTLKNHSWLMVAYDDILGIRYFGVDLAPYWRRKQGTTIQSVLQSAARDHDTILAQCDAFDRELAADLNRVGGPKYAEIANLAYRQAVAANKLVADESGRPLLFPKENFSNGCIGTVDVIYPMAPLWLLLGSDLSKAMLTPVMDYGSSPRWKFPFAPHDLGTYPHATGQVYGGGELTEENQMPVEETGNLILLVAALSRVENNVDFARKYWPTLRRWAAYLREKGLDPANQLCTDDFLGHLAHNANLSVKAILALGAYGQLAEQIGLHAEATEYKNLAQKFAREWISLAQEGDHTKLAFDRPGTWSQKYNMVWDTILDLNVFPVSLKQAEMAFYRQHLNPYGLPLDSRGPGMKVDWLTWTATLTNNKADFEALISPLWDYLNETQDRAPICDWVRTDNTRMISMIARPVIGGVYLPLLQDPDLWRTRFHRGVKSDAKWAPFPLFERATVVPTAETAPADWQYTTNAPAPNWFKPTYDASSWKAGKSGFGTAETPGATVNTLWDSSDIWIRREVVIPKTDPTSLRLKLHYDNATEVYINGVLAFRATGFTSQYTTFPIRPSGLKATRFDRPNLIAVHCHQDSGGQYIDLGFSTEKRISK